jgi:hypothetical protein
MIFSLRRRQPFDMGKQSKIIKQYSRYKLEKTARAQASSRVVSRHEVARPRNALK